LSHKYNVEKLIFIGSSCIYPKFSKNPIKETELLTGSLEPTNQWYALSKIHGVKLCEAYNKQYKSNFSCVMPTNLFGLNDKYDERSHVIPALIKRIHYAKINKKKHVKVWGDGSPRREFLFSDDCAKIICKILLSKSYFKLINIGTGKDITIKKLALTIKKIVGFKGDLKFDKKFPNGIARKKLDIRYIKKLKLNKFTNFKKALIASYQDYLKNHF
jgi:GDP-L-fucose synthase